VLPRVILFLRHNPCPLALADKNKRRSDVLKSAIFPIRSFAFTHNESAGFGNSLPLAGTTGVATQATLASSSLTCRPRCQFQSKITGRRLLDVESCRGRPEHSSDNPRTDGTSVVAPNTPMRTRSSYGIFMLMQVYCNIWAADLCYTLYGDSLLFRPGRRREKS